MTGRQYVLLNVLKQHKGQWMTQWQIAKEVNDFFGEKVYEWTNDERNNCPEIGKDQREINSNSNVDVCIITKHHLFKIAETEEELSAEIKRYFNIAIKKIKRAREFAKKMNANGQFNLLKEEFRDTFLKGLEDNYKETL